jgi:UDP-N-acetylglucosamine 2-epimerase (non-hydrolysing)
VSPRRKVLVVFGTRPEAIKLAPLIAERRAMRELFDMHLCSTGQHRDLLVEPLAAFGLVPDTNLEVMREGQSLASLLGRILAELGPVIEAQRPDICVVQGDTSSAFGGALAGFYAKVPIAHVEAGLRSGDRSSPFPEEEHRILIDSMAHWCFAPTEEARRNLIRENVDSERIWLTGNTGIDALRWLERRSRAHDAELDAYLEGHGVAPEHALLVATIHRREHPDEELADIAKALVEIAASPSVRVIAPVHPNPQVRAILDHGL